MSLHQDLPRRVRTLRRQRRTGQTVQAVRRARRHREGGRLRARRAGQRLFRIGLRAVRRERLLANLRHNKERLVGWLDVDRPTILVRGRIEWRMAGLAISQRFGVSDETNDEREQNVLHTCWRA